MDEFPALASHGLVSQAIGQGWPVLFCHLAVYVGCRCHSYGLAASEPWHSKDEASRQPVGEVGGNVLEKPQPKGEEPCL
jgi:hypothetical protein